MTENSETPANTHPAPTTGNDETKPLDLLRHPRLYLTTEMLERVRHEPTLPYLRDAAARLTEDVERFVDAPPIEYRHNAHNALLLRARGCQKAIVDLLVQYKRTGDRRFRDAVVKYVRRMGEWEYWSWIAWRQRDTVPDAIFDLSYGENSATLAIAYDVLHDELTDDEKTLFIRVARERPIPSGMKNCRPGGGWWFGEPGSNWNTVCAGGLGMLCLAMYDDTPEARKLLPRVEQSIEPFMKYLEETDGGWPEGLGYWNYGMRYAFMYLLSHENATGCPHPLMQLEGVRKTMLFPLDFTPHGKHAGFGDAGQWVPLPIHWAVAQRLQATEALAALHIRLNTQGILPTKWASDSEFLTVHPDKAPEPSDAPTEPILRLYQGIDWGLLADRMPDPSLYLSIRGGTTKVHHAHRDLLSFHCMVDGEALVESHGGPPYLDTTFTPRRDEIFEVSPASKNGLFINGVGIAADSALDSTDPVRADGILGYRLISTTPMGEMRDGPAARFCGRLALMLESRAILLIDRAVLTQVGVFESRIHTFHGIERGENGVLITGKKAKMRVAYASTVPAHLGITHTIPTLVDAPVANVLRWGTPASLMQMTFATLLSPGDAPAEASIAEKEDIATITVRTEEWETQLRVDAELRLLSQETK